MPGLFGLSGMQVKLFLPLRNVRICILSSMAMTVASLATAFGAADRALLTICSSLAPWVGPTMARTEKLAARAKKTELGCIGLSSIDHRDR